MLLDQLTAKTDEGIIQVKAIGSGEKFFAILNILSKLDVNLI